MGKWKQKTELGKYRYLTDDRASLVIQLVKNLPAMRETWVWSLGWEYPLEKGKATHCSIMAWRIPWTVSSMGSPRVGHDWATFTFTLTNDNNSNTIFYLNHDAINYKIYHDFNTAKKRGKWSQLNKDIMFALYIFIRKYETHKHSSVNFHNVNTSM